ncbi:MAG TPA: radical SAM protein, partial [bacterium]|nr:radical SAM protein [bacterium]
MKIRDGAYFAKEIALMNAFPSRRVPLSVHVGVTNRCSNRCRYCNFESRPREDEWETGELLKVLEEIGNAGGRRVQFTGGEPMLRDDIGKVLNRARGLGLFTGLSTNGFSVPGRIGELRGADMVQVSYDGPPEVHGYLRGEKSHAEAVAALDALLAAGIPAWINTVLTTVNSGHIGEIVEFARSRGITANFVLLDFFLEPGGHFHPALSRIEGLVLRGAARREALEELIGLKKAGAPVGG